MDFDFSEEQRMLQRAVGDFLAGEYGPERVRAGWDDETGRDDAFWRRFAEIGAPGLLVPESLGGLGLDETDLVLLLEETGRAALAEPVVPTSVGVGLLRELGGALAERWLPRIAAGEARLAVGHAESPFVADAHVARLLLILRDGALHAVAPEDARLEPQSAVDGSQRLFRVDFTRSERVAEGRRAAALGDAALDRGALCCAAEALGVADRLIGLAVAYASERRQFGVAIGSFQAVKHMLADEKVRLEYARSLVHRAACSVAGAAATRAADVSMAKLAACEAARSAAGTSLQVHGAIGYTYEQDVHVWMKRAWSLDLAYGTSVFHRERLCAALIDGTFPVAHFGYEPAEA